jgi:ribosome-associated protein
MPTGMLQVAPGWVLPAADVELDFVRSAGPGGQNVNKLATKVELRFKLKATRALTLGQKRRLAEAYPSHVTRDGEFILASDRFRSQLQNRRDVMERLARMLSEIRYPPRARVATRPTRASKARRANDKRARSQVKRQRGKPQGDDS